MAIFGEGLGVDPLAAARTAEIARRREQTQRNIELVGQGQNAFGKGVGALSTVAGEHLGSALAGAFGMEQGPSPEMEAAQKQASLIESINLIEGDPASADYARQAAQLAMDGGNQAAAFKFMQQAGARDKAEGVAATKTEADRVKVLAENFGRQPASMKIALIANNDPNVRSALGYEEGEEWDKVVSQAEEQRQSDLIKVKAAAAKIVKGMDTSISAGDVKVAGGWVDGSNIAVDPPGFFGDEEASEKMSNALNTLVAAEAAALAGTKRADGSTPNQNELNEIAFQNLVERGQVLVEDGTGKSVFGTGYDIGTRVVTGFGQRSESAPKPATTGTGKRHLNLSK